MSEFEYVSIPLQRPADGIRGVEDDIRALQKEYELAVFDLERKWSAKFKEAYERRFAYISGTAAPTGEEITAGELKSRRLDSGYEILPTLKGEAKPASLDNFWLNVLFNSHIESYIVKTDVPALKHLTNIVLSYPSKDKVPTPAFAIDFHFSPNAFFKNTKLKLTFYYKDEINAAGQLLYSHIAVDKVNWKPKKNLVQKAAKDGQGSDDDEGEESFFSIFEPSSSITTPSAGGTVNKNDDFEKDMALDHAFDFGLELKQLVLPNAADYLLGEAEGEDDDDDDDDDDWDEYSVGGESA
ncbi:nucleosome assembly protein [Armillaria novae-zelandiae]|uniref:Nucleosome assembly protein n=1 Tax=Armillaria novae-zelandiae TaxID=153914 RepID=A0AA39TX01_9AGAR|nr:nucleosome assembly protein [Armillaria novae-zelandiae]